MLSTALSKYDMPLLTNGSMMMAFAVAGFIYCTMQTDLLEDFKASCLSPRLHLLFQDTKRSPAIARGIYANGMNKNRRKLDRNEVNWTVARILSVVILILYLVTLFASSFVEEEHQFWYFFSTTWWVVLALTSGRYLATADLAISASEKKKAEEEAIDETRQGWSVPSSAIAAGCCLLQMTILRLLTGLVPTPQ